MERRDFVKAIMATSLTGKAMLGQQVTTPAGPVAPSVPPPAPAAATPPPPGPTPWMSGLTQMTPSTLQPLVPDAVAQTTTSFFGEARLTTLRRLCDLFMPAAKGYPGARQAGVPEFLDFLIGVSPVDRQTMYTMGLDRLESEARQKFGASFASIDNTQADQLIRPWLRTWMNDHPPAEPYAHFINVAHSDIRTGTVNSQEWNLAATKEGKGATESGVYWYPIEPDLHGEKMKQTTSANA